LCAAVLRGQAPVVDRPVVDVIRAAVLERLGPDVELNVTVLSAPAEPALFRSATPAPSAWLGKAIRFSLISANGRSVAATAEIRVVATYATTTHSISRGQVLKADDIAEAKSELRDLPLRRLPTVDGLVGAKALRPLAAGTAVQASFVQVRRIIEPGDKVTAVAGAGAIEVTATLVAADGGGIGDVIRVVNPETRRYVRARIVRSGFVEVMHER
jgi:flagella basal body P-ring formation protein FlgA